MDTQLTQETETIDGVIFHPLLPRSDWDKMSEDERRAFHDMEESLTTNFEVKIKHYQQQFPRLALEWTFQIEAYLPKNEEELPDA